MKKKNQEHRPIFFSGKFDKTYAKEMDKPLSEIMEDLRMDLTVIRGKLGDIRNTYGWNDRITDLEGGLTCMLMAMHVDVQEWKEFEKKHNKQFQQ